ncbi:hypothetical protein [Candidatus Viridilinea mediisalina]|nr:hypothetical protein [Candidatus Viridilinea mediisalina]
MSHHNLARFLERLLLGHAAPVGPVDDRVTIQQLVLAPPTALQRLLGAHVDALLAAWPGAAALRPHSIPSTTLWLAAALNNLAWAAERPDPRLLGLTIHLARALPTARDGATALAYHSLLRYVPQLLPHSDWLPVVRLLLTSSPLSEAWLPRRARLRPLLLELLGQPSIQMALRDRWLSLWPDLATAQATVPLTQATANVELGGLLGDLLEHDQAWQRFILSFYEADCYLQRQGDHAQPSWPVLVALGQAAQTSNDVRQRRHATRTLTRYQPLATLLQDERRVRPYLYLDGRFLSLVADLVPLLRLRAVREVA